MMKLRMNMNFNNNIIRLKQFEVYFKELSTVIKRGLLIKEFYNIN